MAAIKGPSQLTLSECRQELDAEHDLNMLRGLIAVLRILRHMGTVRATGKVEGDVHDGVLKSWRFPETVAVVTPARPAQK
jgi:hypothetical protein